MGQNNNIDVTREEFNSLRESIQDWSKKIKDWTEECASIIEELKVEQKRLAQVIDKLTKNYDKNNKMLLYYENHKKLLDRKIKDLELGLRNTQEDINTVNGKIK